MRPAALSSMLSEDPIGGPISAPNGGLQQPRAVARAKPGAPAAAEDDTSRSVPAVASAGPWRKRGKPVYTACADGDEWRVKGRAERARKRTRVFAAASSHGCVSAVAAAPTGLHFDTQPYKTLLHSGHPTGDPVLARAEKPRSDAAGGAGGFG